MTEETEGTQPEETKPEETQPEVKDIKGDAALDESGVSYKNRAAEAKRKLEQKEEEYEAMSARVQAIEAKVAAEQTAPTAPATNDQDKKKEELAEMVRLGPAEYNRQLTQKILQAEKMKQEEASAIDLIKESYGVARAAYGIEKVKQYANENMINIHANPVKAIKKILSEINKPKAKTPTVEEKKKAAEAIKNKPIKGSQTSAPPVKSNTNVQDNLRNRGSMEDSVAWLEDRFKDK